MEKIFYTINNYFSSLEGAGDGETADVEAAPVEQSEVGVSEEQTEPPLPDQGGDDASVSEQVPGSTDEPQNPEASIINNTGAENDNGVQNAPPAGEAEVNTEEPLPGEDHTTPEKQ